MLEFAAKEVGPRTAPELTLTTQVERDLGITGDDAEIFIQKFAATFSVDMTGFQFNKYFGSEGGFLPAILIEALLAWLRRKPFNNRVPITIGDLVLAAETGKWPTGVEKGVEKE